MNKVLIAVCIAVCAAALVEISAARKDRDHDRHPNRRQNCSNAGNKFETNMKCAMGCWRNSSGAQWGSCQNGACACFNRNSNTSTTTSGPVTTTPLPTTV